ncbi:hypothetical protein [Flagellimonas iocasae]|uniref:Uncharacterized protein n=1 Tax=Flagellimonas iocasae TaxID=2055905 RepID=A0ABW4XXJ1_9FLAO
MRTCSLVTVSGVIFASLQFKNRLIHFRTKEFSGSFFEIRRLALIFFLFLSFSFGFTQEFEKTEEFYIDGITAQQMEKIRSGAYGDDEPSTLTISLRNKYGKVIDKQKIYDMELFFGTEIVQLSDPGLLNVDKVVRLQMTHVVCCSDYKSQYYIFRNDGEVIKLPALIGSHCALEDPLEEYIFPNQKFGQPDKIIHAISNRGRDGETIKTVGIEAVNQYNWAGSSVEKDEKR